MSTDVVLEGTFPTIEEEESDFVVEVWAGFGDGDATRLRGILIDAVAPADGDFLVYDDATERWKPAPLGEAITVDWASVTGTPTTLAGYGITDAALDADLDAHIARVDNPHSVTKTQVGLGNVENTALSTWTGSANITTLGTIGSGVWQGTPIAAAYLGAHIHALADITGFGADGGYIRSDGGAWVRVGGVAAADLTGTIASARVAGDYSGITGVGTIATGVWNATAIAWAKVDKAGSSLADLATRSAGDLSSGNLAFARLPTGDGSWDTGVGTTITIARALTVSGALTGTLTGNADTATTAGRWTTARNLAGNSVDGSANVAFANKFIMQGTVDAGLSAAQFLGALGTGIVKNTTTTGVLSIAVAGDFPTLNQNTTGSAATLSPGRTINGVAFDGSTNITVAAAAGTVTGTVLNATVVTSSLTAIGTLASGAVPASLVTAGTFGAGNYAFPGTLTAADNVGIAATKRFYFDGVALTGNTYVSETGADVLTFTVGGNSELIIDPVGAGGVAIRSGQRLFFDGGGDTHFRESSANDLRLTVGGTQVGRYLSTGVSVTGTFSVSSTSSFSDSAAFFAGSGAATAQSIRVTGDSVSRLAISGDGTLSWGDGSAAADATMKRSGSKTIQMSAGGNLMFTFSDTQMGFFGHALASRPAAYTPTNVTTDRAFNANATTLDEVADVLGTVIADLQSLGVFQ